MAEKHAATPERIAALLERLGRLTRGIQHASGFKPAQWEALRFLARANRHSRTPAALSEFLGSTRGTVSQTLITLEKKGLVHRAPSAEDGRSVELSLTPKGWDLMRQDPLNQFSSVISAMPNQTALASGLDGLMQELQQRHGITAFGTCRECRYFRANGTRVPEGYSRCALTGIALDEEESAKICRDFALA